MHNASVFINAGRIGALVAVLLAVIVFSAGSRFWLNRSLLATWLIFVGILGILLAALGYGLGWYPRTWQPWITGALWWVLAVLFVGWTLAFLTEQTKTTRAAERDARRPVGQGSDGS